MRPLAPHTLAAMREASSVRALLIDQRNRLVRADRPDSCPSAKAIAKRYVAMIGARLSWDDDTLRILGGRFGPNGWGPAVDDIVAQLEHRGDPVRVVAGERLAA